MINISEAKKELVILLISLIMLLCFVSSYFIYNSYKSNNNVGDSSSLENENIEWGNYDFSDKYYYNQLSPISRREFKRIYHGVQNYESSIVVEDLSVQELNKIIYILYFDCPELFYLSDSSQNFNHIGEKATTYYPRYTYSKDTVAKMEEEILTVAMDIKERFKNSPPIEIEKNIHDYLISNITYSQETDNCMNIYGALIEGKANCKGYSSSFTYLTRLLGLSSAQIIGYAAESSAAVGHSWNAIKINDNYYYLDICWDDFDERPEYGGLKGAYLFFNLPANKMALSHDPTETIEHLGEPPIDNDSSLIYYKQAGFYADSLTSAKSIIHTGVSRVGNNESKYIILQCDTQDVYDSVLNNLQSIVKSEIEEQNYGFSECEFININKSRTIILADFS